MYGGYCAINDMPNTPNYPTWFADRAAEKHMLAMRGAHTDFGVWGGFDVEITDVAEVERRLTKMMPLVVGLKSYQGTTQGNVGTFDLSHEGLYKNLTTYAELRARGGMRQPLALHAREEIGYDTAEFMMRKFGQAVYWCHVSTETEIGYAERLKKAYPDLFDAEGTLHHMTMTHVDARTHYGWLGARMQPPLGKENDFEKVLWGFNSGVISTLGTDHAPHPDKNKLRVEELNPQASEEEGCVSCYGVGGIQFVIPVLFAMIRRGETTVDRVVDALHTQPHRILGITPRNARTLIEIDTYRIGDDEDMSASQNTPYVNWTAGARVLDVIVDGVSRFDHSQDNVRVVLPKAA
jgi:dihydroorotase